MTGNQQNVGASSLPTQTKEYVDNNYPDAVITNVSLYNSGTARYVVKLNTTEILAFNTAGGFLCDSTAIDSIPSDSFGMHGFHWFHWIHWHHGHPGHFGPGCGGPGHGTEPGFGHGHGHGIPSDSLAQAIVNYVTGNYPGYIIEHANIDSLCQFGNVTEVVADDSIGHVKLYFDASNNYLMKDNRINYSAIPQVITAYVTSNYSGYFPCFRAIKFTLADGSIEYMVFLKGNHAHKRVTFKEDGTFVCEQ